MKRCSTEATILWVLASLYDNLKTGLITAPELALRQLQGRNMPGGKGIIDFLVAKKAVAEAFFKLGEEKGIANVLLAKMDLWKNSMFNYRADVGYWDPEKKCYTVDNQCMVALPPSAQSYLKLWEESVILPDFDPLIKQCKVSGTTIKDGFLDKQPVKDWFDSIFEDLMQENGGRPEQSDKSGAVKLQEVDEMTAAGDDDNAEIGERMLISPRKNFDDPEGKINKWADYVRQKINRVVKLIVHPMTIEGVARAFNESATWLCHHRGITRPCL